MKKIYLVLLFLMSFFVIQANATTLHISNLTNSPLFFSINGECRSDLYTAAQATSAHEFKGCAYPYCLIQGYKNSCFSDYVGGLVYREEDGAFLLDGGDVNNISITANVQSDSLSLIYTEAITIRK